MQAINGCYRTSENFFAGVTENAERLPSACILPPEVQIGREYSDLSEYAEDVAFVKTGYLIKQGSLVKSWKRRLFTLRDGVLQYADSTLAVKGERIIDNESRVILLPPVFDGRPYCFALLTTDMSGTVTSLRLSAEDQRTMSSWIDALEVTIRSYKDDCETFLTDDMDNDDCGPLNASPPHDRFSPRLAMVWQDGLDDFDVGQNSQGSDSPIDGNVAGVRIGKEVLPPVSSTANWYLNDDTLWSRMRRHLSSRQHDAANVEIQAHYMTHFCSYIDTRNAAEGKRAAGAYDDSIATFILVEVFEHQRYVPLTGWSPLNLLPTDCAKLANRYGVKFPDRYLRRAEAPIGYCWSEESDAVALSDARIDITSPWKWTCCRSKHLDGAGGKGWTYGMSFADIRNCEAQNRVRLQPHVLDLTRRRRWLRVAMLIGSKQDVMQLPFENLFLRAQYSSHTSSSNLGETT